MMWMSLFLIVLVVCITVDDMFEKYLNKKYRYDEREQRYKSEPLDGEENSRD